MELEKLALGEKKEYPEWDIKDLTLMSPGPTQVAPNIRKVRSYNVSSPIVDKRFFDFYKETCEKMAQILDTKSTFYIMNGEGILGLEAACASMTEKGDRVLVLDNGVYGKGFADFIELYQGEAVVVSFDYHRPIDAKELKVYLEKDHDFKYATLVHSDTPSGILNPVETLCPLLKSYGIMTVVDSVTGMFGDELSIDKAQIDICCGGSQKALSAPPGLTMVAVSETARKAMHERKTPIASFYANLLTFETYYEDMHFPYTQPISDIYGLRAALEDVDRDTNRFFRHKVIAKAVRQTLSEAGLKLYLEDGYASTVTAFYVPDGLTDKQIMDEMLEKHHIIISGSLGDLKGKLMRIGHMGNNANVTDVKNTLSALTQVLQAHDIPVKEDMGEAFVCCIEEME